MIYKHKRAQLISNLSRPKAAITPIEANQKGFFQTRRNMEFGPVPVGYWEKVTLNSPARRQVSDNKVRASLLSIHNNEWWNDGFQESLRNAAQATNPVAVEQNKAAQEASYFQQTIMQANRLAGSISADTFQSTEIWNEIQSSAPVMKALQRLSNSVEYTVQRMRTMGIPEDVARDAIRKAAIAAGNTMTGAGYDKERAATITAMVVRGELSITGASNQVANDIQQANEAVAALNTNTANTPTAMWRNDYNIHAVGPSGGGVSLKQLQQMRQDLNNELSLENDPVARNQLVEALNNLEKEIKVRQSGISELSNAMGPLPPGVAPIATQGNGYDPLSNFRANQSTMETTVAALTSGGPDLWNIVDDIVTIQGNMYFDYMAGNPIIINEQGEVLPFNNMADESTIFPEGSFTVYSSRKSSIRQLEIVLSGIANALNSPHIPENEKGYLRYLRNIISYHVEKLRTAAAINQATPNDPFNNLVNLPVNGGEGLPEIIQNNANNVPPTVQNQNQNPAAQHLVQQNNSGIQQPIQTLPGGPMNNLPTTNMGLEFVNPHNHYRLEPNENFEINTIPHRANPARNSQRNTSKGIHEQHSNKTDARSTPSNQPNKTKPKAESGSTIQPESCLPAWSRNHRHASRKRAQFGPKGNSRYFPHRFDLYNNLLSVTRRSKVRERLGSKKQPQKLVIRCHRWDTENSWEECWVQPTSPLPL